MQKTNCTTCEKREEWCEGFVALICSLLSWMFGVGAWHVFRYRFLSGIWFLLLSFANGLCCAYVSCRHCYYYGKRCYAGLGLVVPFIFKKSEQHPSDIQMIAWSGIFAANFLYPIILLFKKNSLGAFIKSSLIYALPPVIACGLILFTCCPQCKNVHCMENPERKSGGA